MFWVWLALSAPADWKKVDPHLPIDQRLQTVSSGFLGTRYVNSPLGEGEGFDADPLLRYDAVDCLTFVEQTIALSIARDDESLLSTLNQIRYEHGTPDYQDRNHVMEAQWLPVNVKKGFLRDVTRQLGGSATVDAVKELGELQWNEKTGKSLSLETPHQARGTFKWPIIPAEKALEKLKQAKPGSVVVVVRADRPRLVTRVSHVGFLVHKPSGPHLRHASRSFGRVVDEPLAKYLERNLGYGKWTVEGLSVFEVQTGSERAERPGP